MAVGAGLLAGAGAAATGISEVLHRRALGRDELWTVLQSPVLGDGFEVVSADGTEIHGELFGASSGAPLVVLAPGWTEELHYYDLLIRALLERGSRVATYDLRGQGASDRPVGGDQALERYGEDLDAVLAYVAGFADARDDVLVAGHSMGAMAIAAWAVSHDVRARVRGVALMNTGLDGLVSASHVLPQLVPSWALQWLGNEVMLGAATPHLPVSTVVGRSLLRYLAFGPDASEALIAFYEPMLWRCPPRVRAGAGRAMAAMNLLPAVERIDVPTLVIAGSCDRLTPVSHSERIAAALPSLVDLVVLERVGHMSPLEVPSAIAALLERLAGAAGVAADEALGAEAEAAA